MPHKKTNISKYLVIFAGLITVLGSLGFARFGYSMILPGMKRSLLLTYTQIGIIESANFTGYLLFAIIGGIMASRYGPKIVISTYLFIVGISMLLTGFIHTFLQALLLRSLTGAGSGGANIPAMILPSIWYSANRRGLAAGIIASGSGLGLIITGFLVPHINTIFDNEGWRYSWITLGSITLLFTAICAITIKNPITNRSSIHTKSKILGWKRLTSDTLLWKIGFTYSMFGISYIIYVTFFGAYLINEIYLTTETTGLLWALVGGLSLFSGPLWGHISDRIGRGNTLTLVYSIQSLSYYLFSTTEIFPLYLSIVLFGITAWSIPSIIAAYSSDHLGPTLAFSALGFLTLFFGVGQAIGPSTAGYIADVTHTFTSSFLLSSAMAALGCFLSIKFLRKY